MSAWEISLDEYLRRLDSQRMKFLREDLDGECYSDEVSEWFRGFLGRNADSLDTYQLLGVGFNELCLRYPLDDGWRDVIPNSLMRPEDLRYITDHPLFLVNDGTQTQYIHYGDVSEVRTNAQYWRENYIIQKAT